MKREEQWKQFCQTGSVDDYLSYACASEQTQMQAVGKGSEQRAGESAGNGIVSIINWGK